MTQITKESSRNSVQAGNLRINYHEAGAGEPLLLLHGTGPGASSWGNWQFNLPDLSASFRVLAPDMPHYGDSEKPRRGWLDIAAYSETMRLFLEQVGVKKTHIIGNSVGGSVAMRMALDQPEIVNRLVLMGTAGSITLFAPQPTEGATLMINYYHGDGPSREKMRAILEMMIFDRSRITPEFVEQRYQASIAPDLMVDRDEQDLAKLSWFSVLWLEAAKINHPTLLIFGYGDRVVPWDAGLVLLKTMPNADLHIFGRSGHWTQWERADAFNRLVTGFFKAA